MNREALQIDGEYPTGSNMLDKLAKKGLIMRERVS